MSKFISICCCLATLFVLVLGLSNPEIHPVVTVVAGISFGLNLAALIVCDL